MSFSIALLDIPVFLGPLARRLSAFNANLFFSIDLLYTKKPSNSALVRNMFSGARVRFSFAFSEIRFSFRVLYFLNSSTLSSSSSKYSSSLSSSCMSSACLLALFHTIIFSIFFQPRGIC